VRQLQRVAAYNVCVADGRILLCRLSAITEAPGSWTLPGGGIDFGEDPADAAIRELREETGLDGEIDELLAVDSYRRVADSADGEVDYHAIRIIYRTTVTGVELAHEADGSTDMAGWFTHADLATLPVVPTAMLGARFAFGNDA
jgi:ADP-ribose pyrophosphatase YjhB (NUDIX family)